MNNDLWAGWWRIGTLESSTGRPRQCGDAEAELTAAPARRAAAAVGSERAGLAAGPLSDGSCHDVTLLRVNWRAANPCTKYMKRYVLTGAPGAGKTAIIRQLELDGFSVVEEAATDIIALWQAKGIAEAWNSPGFIDAIVSLQQTRERRGASLPDLVQFHDRSVVCTAALADYLRVPRPQNLMQELERVKAQNVFHETCFIAKESGFHHAYRSTKDYLRRNGPF